jgi:hypothetical protein
MASTIPTTTIAVSTIQGVKGTLHLEQITVYEAKRRGLESTEMPKLFERQGRATAGENEPFVFTDQDFQVTPEKRILLVPDDAVAYVVGEDSNGFRSMRDDYEAPDFTYVPVQFYKNKE